MTVTAGELSGIRVGTPAIARKTDRHTQPDPGTFADVLRSATELKFSAHARQRLAGATLDPSQLSRLTDAVDSAAARGCRESVVLLDGMALVVSVRNRTVITAVDDARMKDSIFTNVDSAIIVSQEKGAGPR